MNALSLDALFFKKKMMTLPIGMTTTGWPTEVISLPITMTRTRRPPRKVMVVPNQIRKFNLTITLKACNNTLKLSSMFVELKLVAQSILL